MVKQFEFTEEYGEHEKGEIVKYDKKLYHVWIHPLLMKGILKIVGRDVTVEIKEKIKVKEEFDNTESINLRIKLNEMKMQELRKFGDTYGAKDTKKSELVDEIIEMAPMKDIKKFIGE